MGKNKEQADRYKLYDVIRDLSSILESDCIYIESLGMSDGKYIAKHNSLINANIGTNYSNAFGESKYHNRVITPLRIGDTSAKKASLAIELCNKDNKMNSDISCVYCDEFLSSIDNLYLYSVNLSEDDNPIVSKAVIVKTGSKGKIYALRRSKNKLLLNFVDCDFYPSNEHTKQNAQRLVDIRIMEV